MGFASLVSGAYRCFLTHSEHCLSGVFPNTMYFWSPAYAKTGSGFLLPLCTPFLAQRRLRQSELPLTDLVTMETHLLID